MRAAALVTLAGLIASPALAQQPNFVNTRVVARAAQPDVARAIAGITKSEPGPAWIGYAVAVLDNDSAGRHDGWSERCRLEQQRVDPATNTPVQGPVRLEPAPTVMVLVRVQAGEVRRVRPVSGDCQVDAGGLQLFWLGDVSGAQSVEFLKTLVTDAEARDRSESALSAIALHRDPAAATAILDLAKSGTPKVRQRALFWIARRAESQAAGIISQAIDNDPDVEVKKQAVFALSQLPRDEGIPLLIKLARSHTHPIVRKQSMFWLGQSKDPRALTFFEEVLR
jgi:HEAT repeat protein